LTAALQTAQWRTGADLGSGHRAPSRSDSTFIPSFTRSEDRDHDGFADRGGFRSGDQREGHSSVLSGVPLPGRALGPSGGHTAGAAPGSPNGQRGPRTSRSTNSRSTRSRSGRPSESATGRSS